MISPVPVEVDVSACIQILAEGSSGAEVYLRDKLVLPDSRWRVVGYDVSARQDNNAVGITENDVHAMFGE